MPGLSRDACLGQVRTCIGQVFSLQFDKCNLLCTSIRVDGAVMVAAALSTLPCTLHCKVHLPMPKYCTSSGCRNRVQWKHDEEEECTSLCSRHISYKRIKTLGP